MAVTINASTSSGLVQSADNSGIIQFQSNGSTKATLSSSGFSYTGGVLQVVQATSTSSFSTSSTSYVTTSFSASITPTSSSSKVLVFVNGGGLDTWQSSDNTVYMALYRGASTSLGFIDVFGYSSRTIAPLSFAYLDSPATTSSTTYTLYLKSGGAYTVYLNSRNETASITLMEIAA